MDLGLLFFPHPTNTAEIARRIEGLGFRSLVLADTQNLAPETWSQLMVAATATSRIELGPGVTNPVSRDPAVTASAALGVQVASGGRLVIGIGRGDSSMAKIGRKPASPADFELYLRQLRGYLDGDTVERNGTESRIEWLDGIDVAHIPIEVSATGPKVIAIAAAVADRICFAVGADLERLAECVSLARQSAEAVLNGGGSVAESARDCDGSDHGCRDEQRQQCYWPGVLRGAGKNESEEGRSEIAPDDVGCHGGAPTLAGVPVRERWRVVDGHVVSSGRSASEPVGS